MESEIFVNFSHLIEWLKNVRKSSINDSPYMDNALLNMQQILEIDLHNPCIFEYMRIGGCEKCRWRNRPQKCSCCRRNKHMKDCFEDGGTS